MLEMFCHARRLLHDGRETLRSEIAGQSEKGSPAISESQDSMIRGEETPQIIARRRARRRDTKSDSPEMN